VDVYFKGRCVVAGHGIYLNHLWSEVNIATYAGRRLRRLVPELVPETGIEPVRPFSRSGGF
jgi:hypothetical protein